MALVDALVLRFGPVLGLAAEPTERAHEAQDAELMLRLLKQLNVPKPNPRETVAEWIVGNSRAFAASFGSALHDTLPASKYRDSLQQDLEDELKQWAAEPRGGRAAATTDRLIGIVARFTEYVLLTMPMAAPTSVGYAAASGGSDLSEGTLSGYALTLSEVKLDRAIRTDDLSVKLAEDLRLLSDLAERNFAKSTAQLRQQIRDTIASAKSAAVQLLAKNPNDGVATAIRDEAAFRNENETPTLWAWALMPEDQKKGVHAITKNDTHLLGHLNDLDETWRIRHVRQFQQTLAAHVSNLNVAKSTVFQKYGDPFIPLVETARKARDDMATELTTKPSDSMALATLHQRQADFSVLAQALSSVIRNLQRIADNIINAMR